MPMTHKILYQRKFGEQRRLLPRDDNDGERQRRRLQQRQQKTKKEMPQFYFLYIFSIGGNTSENSKAINKAATLSSNEIKSPSEHTKMLNIFLRCVLLFFCSIIMWRSIWENVFE